MSTLKVDTLQNAVGENLVFNNKNLLINGAMNVWQRSTSATASSTGYKTVDRFQYSQNGNGAYTQSQSTDVPSGQGFGYSMKMDVTTANASPAAGNYSMFMQKMEGQNLQHLLKGTSSAKKLTLSFWVKSNKTGTYIARFSDEDNSRTIAKSYTISSASTWEKKEITFEGDTTGALDNDNAESLTIQFWLSAGTSYTSGTLATSWETSDNANVAPGITNLLDSTSNEWYITGIQLETGSDATDFEFEPYETTLNKCLRYHYEVGTISYEGPGGLQTDGGYGTLCMRYNIAFPVPMRNNPTPEHGTFTLNRRSGGGSSVMSWITATNTNTKNNIWTLSTTRAYAQWGQYNQRGAGEAMQGTFPDVYFDSEL